MSRVRSPSHPSITLEQAIVFSEKIHAHNRTNPIDREAAVKDMGFTGITGHSGKMIASLIQFGLLEKYGKGEVRITERAVDILHPDTEVDRLRALNAAAFEPQLFARLHQRFSDGIPSENNLRSFLVREGFTDAAVGAATTSYLETCRFLQLEKAYDFNDTDMDAATDSKNREKANSADGNLALNDLTRSMAGEPRSSSLQIASHSAERIVLSEENAPGQYIKLIASGEIDETLIEALEDFIKRQRKRLAK